MPLAFLSRDYLNFSLYGEYIFLDFTQGHIQVREVYDLFFTPVQDVEPKLLCISPHNLLSDGALGVQAVAGPGCGGADDWVYESPLGFGRAFEPGSHRCSVRLFDARKPHAPQTESISGEAIMPAVQIPDMLGGIGHLSFELMESVGTVFEVRCPPLSHGETYAIRLVVEPIELLGFPSPRSLASEIHEFRTEWRQDASIACSKTCHFDVQKLLETAAAAFPKSGPAVGGLLALIASKEMHVVSAQRVRILLILPQAAELESHVTHGCIMALAQPISINNRRVQEWRGGTSIYWTDDVEHVAHAVWTYLHKWAAEEPKSKESITVALAINHENCTAALDSLEEHGAVEVTNIKRGLYRARELSWDDQNQVLRAIALDPKVKARFRWSGYRISYTVRYPYISPEDRRRLSWSRRQSRLTLWLALAAVLLSVTSLLLCLFALLL